MTLGDVLVTAGSLAALATGIAALLPNKSSRMPATRVAVAAVAFALLTTSLGLLAWKFLLPDLSTFYVWSEASAANPWYYRLAGLWASQPGTLLLWAWYTSGAAVVLSILAKRRDPPATRIALALSMGIAAVLAAYAQSLHLFSATSDWRITTITSGPTRLTDWIYAPAIGGPTPLDLRPQGNSLNPLLLSPFMVIHPWLEFAAYAFTGIAWSVACAMLITRTEDQRETLWPWARLAWAFYTIAITLGALWAYYTLSFGGYWAWDPVETANLIPWIVLTALLHTRPTSKATLATPALAASAFALTLFATFATRTGLWASSVHAFINATTGNIHDAAARLTDILGTTNGMSDLARLLVLAWGIPAVLLLRRGAEHSQGIGPRTLLRAHSFLTGALVALAVWDPVSSLDVIARIARFSGDVVYGALLLAASWVSIPILAWLIHSNENGAKPSGSWLPREPTLLRAGVALIALWALVTLVLLVRGVNGSQRGVYDARVPLIAAPIALVALAAFSQRALGRSRAPWAILGAAGIGVVIAISSPARDLGGRVAAFDAVLLTALASVGLWSAVKGANARARFVRVVVLAAGVVLLILASSPPPFIGSTSIPPALTPVGIVTGLMLIAFAFFPRRMGVRVWAREALTGTVPLMHVAVALLFVGFGLSTFLSQEATFTMDRPIAQGETVSIGSGYALTFERSDGVIDPAQSSNGTRMYQSVTTYLLVSRWDKPLGEVPLRMYFVQAKDHYDPSSFVLRQPDGDLYINANFANAHAMYSDADGWVVGHGPTTTMTSANITKIAMTVRVLPFVNLLWGGLWLLVACGFARVLLPLAFARQQVPLVAVDAAVDGPIRAAGRL